MLMLGVARYAVGRVRAGGTFLFIGGTGPPPGRRLGLIGDHRRTPGPDRQPGARDRPVRVNLIAAGFVDTPLSASLLGDQLEERREQLRETLPIGRVVGPDDVARLAIHLMANTALTGATYDVDGGQQLVAP